MKLPLPDGVKPAFTQAGHAGLWFNRFFDRYGTDKESKPPDPWSIGKTDKHDWLKDFPKHARGDKAVLEQHAWRTIDLIKARGGDVAVFELNWHFVTGMGYPHPVENGLAWHPTLGVPYLTGAAVKGMVRSWMEVWQGATEAELRCWFGSETKDPEKLADNPPIAGELVFFDALPIVPVTLTVDIMTPHMGKWYEQGGEITSVANSPDAVPADWHDPIPVQYLVVKKAQFLFGVAPRRQGKLPEGEIKTILNKLADALSFMGAGAKTAVGYGQMTRQDDLKTELQRKQQQQAQERQHQQAQEKAEREYQESLNHLSEISRVFAKEAHAGDWANNKDAFTQQGIPTWLDKLEAMETPDAHILQTLEQRVRHYYSGLLDDPDKMKGKGKYHFKENQRKFAHRLLALLNKGKS